MNILLSFCQRQCCRSDSDTWCKVFIIVDLATKKQDILSKATSLKNIQISGMLMISGLHFQKLDLENPISDSLYFFTKFWIHFEIIDIIQKTKGETPMVIPLLVVSFFVCFFRYFVFKTNKNWKRICKNCIYKQHSVFNFYIRINKHLLCGTRIFAFHCIEHSYYVCCFNFCIRKIQK